MKHTLLIVMPHVLALVRNDSRQRRLPMPSFQLRSLASMSRVAQPRRLTRSVFALATGLYVTITAWAAPPSGTDGSLTLVEEASTPLSAADFGFTDSSDNPPDVFNRILIHSLPTAGYLSVDRRPAMVGEVVPLTPVNGVWRRHPENAGWQQIALSGDGRRQLSYGNHRLMVSHDGGLTWTSSEEPDIWVSTSLASSADGTRLAAALGFGRIFVSDNAGATWTARASERNWRRVVCSADGTTMAAFDSEGAIYVSTDEGVTWLGRGVQRSWNALAISADGSRIMITGYNEPLFVSTNHGSTWSFQGPAQSPNGALACSADGLTLLTAVNGAIVTSFDGGVTWTDRPQAPPPFQLINLACSADGQVMLLGTVGGLFRSGDAGATWNPLQSEGTWSAVAISADATTIVAIEREFDGTTHLTTSVASVPEIAFTPARDGFGSPYGAFTFQVGDDGETGANLDLVPRSMTINVTPVNDPPVTVHPPLDLTAPDGSPLLHQLPFDTFLDVDETAPLILRAETTQGAPLPPWLHFDPVTQRFSGTPGPGDKAVVEILLTATDQGTPPLSASTRFSVTVPHRVPAGMDAAVTLDEDTSWHLVPSTFGFTDLEDSPPNRLTHVTLTTLPEASRGATEARLTIDGIAALVGEVVPLVPDIRWRWTEREGPQPWSDLVISDDGTLLAGLASPGRIYLSTDFGDTWSRRETKREWRALACSSDGTTIVATAADGALVVSTDRGTTWQARGGTKNWSAVAISADGSRIIAPESSGSLWISPDRGETWIERQRSRVWMSVASSDDGQWLFAAELSGPIHRSSDFGLTWTRVGVNEDRQRLQASADGSRLIALVNGQLHVSTDHGSTWTRQDHPSTFLDIAMTSDGRRLLASEASRRLYISSDFGKSWARREANRSWGPVASSADGWRLAAAHASGAIYTSVVGTPALEFHPVSNASGSPHTSFTFQVGDDGLGAATLDPTPNTLTFNVLPLNDPPVATTPIHATVATEAAAFLQVIPVPTSIFFDSEREALSSLAVTSADGSPLPAWLRYDEATRTLSGTPAASDTGFLHVRVTATDRGPPPMSGSTAYLLRIQPVDDPPSGTAGLVRVEADASHQFSPRDFGFSDANDHPAHLFTRVKITGLPAAGTLTVDGAPATPGQSVTIQSLPSGHIWTAREQNRPWTSLAASPDGSHLVAAASPGQIHVSPDFGVSWTARESTRDWRDVAVSGDGLRLVGLARANQPRVSMDGGLTWAVGDTDTTQSWSAVTGSADLTKLVAGGLSRVYRSTDVGLVWSSVPSSPALAALAASTDGQRLVGSSISTAGSPNFGYIHVSSDAGRTWSRRLQELSWSGVASSADGRVLFACAANAGLYTSSDFGASWRQCEISRAWSSVATSADGSQVLATTDGGPVYQSIDGGGTWMARTAVARWNQAVVSADGTRLAAAVRDGQIFTSVPAPAQALVFTPAPGALGTPYASFTFQVEDEGAAGANLDPTPRLLTLNVVPPSQSPFAVWARDNALPTDPEAADGRHLLAFAFGLAPGSQAGGEVLAAQGVVVRRGVPALETIASPAGHSWHLTFARRSNSGLTYHVQASADLIRWQNVTDTPEILADDGLIEAVRVTLPAVLDDQREPTFARLALTTE